MAPEQLTFDDALLQGLSPGDPEKRRLTIQEKFEAFHQSNPQVYIMLRSLAFELLNAGVTEFGIELLYAQLRWRHAILTKGADYKLPNNFTSRYARLLMAQEQELSGVFRTCELRTE